MSFQLPVRSRKLQMMPIRKSTVSDLRILGSRIGTQTMRITTKKLFTEGFHRLSGSIDVSNIGMQRVFEKVGWQFEGIHRNFMPEPGERPHDYRVYAITKWDLIPGEGGVSNSNK